YQDETNPAIALASGINWMRAHPGLLQLPPIQMELKKLFLSFRNIEFLRTAQPALLKQMRVTLKECAESCLKNPKTLNIGLLWLRLAYEIETQLFHSNTADKQECLKNIKDLQQRVDRLIITEEGKANPSEKEKEN